MLLGITIFFPIVMILILSIQYEKKLYPKVRTIVIYLLLFGFTISPWLVRNYTHYGYAQLSSITGTNLLFYNVAATEAEKTGIPRDQIAQNLKLLAEQKGASSQNNPYENSAIYTEIAVDYIKANLYPFALRNVKGIINMYLGISSKNIVTLLGYEGKQLKTDQYSASNPIDLIIEFFRTKSIAEIVIASFIAIYLILCYFK